MANRFENNQIMTAIRAIHLQNEQLVAENIELRKKLKAAEAELERLKKERSQSG